MEGHRQTRGSSNYDLERQFRTLSIQYQFNYPATNCGVRRTQYVTSSSIRNFFLILQLRRAIQLRQEEHEKREKPTARQIDSFSC